MSLSIWIRNDGEHLIDRCSRQIPHEMSFGMVNRRDFLVQSGTNWHLALAMMLSEETKGQTSGKLKTLHCAPKAKRVVQLFMTSGQSYRPLGSQTDA